MPDRIGVVNNIEHRPLLTIVVPVYAVEGYLYQCLESIRAGLTDAESAAVEIIAVDDASPDGCGDMLDSYADRRGGVRVLHAGDTVWWPGYAERLERLAPDLAILPINGRDAAREARGVVGNLEPREAADLAVAARIPLVVPCHWDGVTGNTEDPAVFVSYAVRTYPSLGIRLPAVGEGVHVVGR